MTALVALPVDAPVSLSEKRTRCASDPKQSYARATPVKHPALTRRKTVASCDHEHNQHEIDLDVDTDHLRSISALIDDDSDAEQLMPATKRPLLCRAATVHNPLNLGALHLDKPMSPDLTASCFGDFDAFKVREGVRTGSTPSSPEAGAPSPKSPILQAERGALAPLPPSVDPFRTYDAPSSEMAAWYVTIQQQQQQLQQQHQQLLLLQQQQQEMYHQQLYQQHFYTPQLFGLEWGAVPCSTPAMYGWQLAPPPLPLVDPEHLTSGTYVTAQPRQQHASPGQAPSKSSRPSQQHLPWGRLVEMAREQEGSRTLQRALLTMSPLRLQAACDELGPHLGELAINLFGNYLVSSMATLPPAQPALIRALTGRILELIQHAQGSRVVQAAFDALPARTVVSLVAELEGHVAMCADSPHGSWGLCAAFRATRAPFIVSEIGQAIVPLSSRINGSRAVQKIVPEAACHDVDVLPVLNQLIASGPPTLERLANDHFGNYVIQIALRIAQPTPCLQERLVELLLPALPKLSLSKAGSNVAEAIIASASDAQLAEARKLIGSGGTALSMHCYGKHVMVALSRRS